jgi:hypothetical protein
LASQSFGVSRPTLDDFFSSGRRVIEVGAAESAIALIEARRTCCDTRRLDR